MSRTFVVELKVSGVLRTIRVQAHNSSTAAAIASLEVGKDNPRAKVDVIRAWLAL